MSRLAVAVARVQCRAACTYLDGDMSLVPSQYQALPTPWWIGGRGRGCCIDRALSHYRRRQPGFGAHKRHVLVRCKDAAPSYRVRICSSPSTQVGRRATETERRLGGVIWEREVNGTHTWPLHAALSIAGQKANAPGTTSQHRKNPQRKTWRLTPCTATSWTSLVPRRVLVSPKQAKRVVSGASKAACNMPISLHSRVRLR